MSVPRTNSNAPISSPLPSAAKKDVGKPMTSEQRPTAAPFSSPTSTETDAVVLSFPGSRQEDRVSAETATATQPPATTHIVLPLCPLSSNTPRQGGIHKLPPKVMLQIMDSVVEGGDMRKRLETRSVVARVNKEFKGYADASKIMKEDLQDLEVLRWIRTKYRLSAQSHPDYAYHFARRLKNIDPSMSREHIDVAAKIRPNSDTEKELSSLLQFQPPEVQSHIKFLRSKHTQDTSKHDDDFHYAVLLKQADPGLTVELAAMAANGTIADSDTVESLRHRLEFKSPEVRKKIGDIRAQTQREEGEDDLPYALRLEKITPKLSFQDVALAALSTTDPYYGDADRLRGAREEKIKIWSASIR